MRSSEPIAKKKTNYFAWLAAAVVIFGLSTFVYNFIGNQSDSMVYSTGSESKTFILSDGSQVLLNKKSTLTLSNEFGTQLRDMHLEGEAYFKVKNNDDQPFIVNAGILKIEVVGTEFNVNNRKSNKDISVFVNEGKVKVSNANTRTKLLLTANESCHFDNQTNVLRKDEAGHTNATSWFTKNLSFNNVPLGDAIEDIEDHFDINVLVDKVSCLDSLYTSLFNDPNPDEVLTTISSVFDFQIIQKGDKSYLLAGGKCE
jgi:ferric-dicitrate binding protein FerR (iron transport regulator)